MIATAIVVLVAHSATTAQEPIIPTPLNDPEAYALYRVVLSTEWIVQSAHSKRLVIRRETQTYPRCMPSGKPLETDWKPTLDSFHLNNALPRLVRDGYDLGLPYVTIPTVEINAFFVRPKGLAGWSDFYQRYPDSGGFVEVSVPGFDPDHTRAFIYLGHSCGGLCGGGTHYFLEKKNGAWNRVRVPGVAECHWAS